MHDPEKFRSDKLSNKRSDNALEDRDNFNNERVNNSTEDGDETLNDDKASDNLSVWLKASDNLSVWLLAVNAEVLSVADAAKNI